MEARLTDGLEGRKFGTGGSGGAPEDRAAMGFGAPLPLQERSRSRGGGRLSRALVWGGIPGLLIGLALAPDLAARASSGSVVATFLLALLTPPALIVGLAWVASAGAGRLTGRASGGGRRRGFALEEGLVLEGRADQAAAFYQLHVSERPGEPEAYFRLARLHRDHLDEPETAVRWLRAARESCRLGEAQERWVSREIVTIYRHRLGDPARAAPELARLAERLGGTPEGDRVREELNEVKRAIAERSGRGGKTA